MIYQPLPPRYCPRCHTWKERTEFGSNKNSLSCISCWCRVCKSQDRYEQYIKNKDKINQQAKIWQSSHPDARRQIDRRYRKNHPEKEKQKQGRSRARRKNVDRTFGSSDWDRALRYFNGVCAYCEMPPRLWDYPCSLHQDHFISLKRGGGYSPDNIVPACAKCNCSKQEFDVSDWLIAKLGKRKAQKRLEFIRAYFKSLK